MGAITLINFEKSSIAPIGFDNDHLSKSARNLLQGVKKGDLNPSNTIPNENPVPK